MKIATLKKVAPALIRSGIAVHLVSKPGIGKSEFVENTLPGLMQQELGTEFGVLTQNLNSVEPPDVRGFCVPFKKDSGGMGASFTDSPIIPREGAPERGILFLDERNQASHDVQKAAAPLILDGRAGDSQLPEGWVVWSASNRAKDRAGVNRPLMHVVNREIVLNIEPDVDSWCEWAFAANIHPLFIAYAKFKPSVVFDADMPTEPEPFCTPRSFTRFHNLLDEYSGGHISDALSKDAIATELGMGMLGKGAATEVMAFLKVAAHLPTYKSIVDTPDRAVKELPKDRPDVMFACCTMIASNIDAKHAEPVFKFIDKLPKEFQVSTVKSCIERTGGSILNHEKFSDWVGRNQALINASFNA